MHEEGEADALPGLGILHQAPQAGQDGCLGGLGIIEGGDRKAAHPEDVAYIGQVVNSCIKSVRFPVGIYRRDEGFSHDVISLQESGTVRNMHSHSAMLNTVGLSISFRLWTR